MSSLQAQIAWHWVRGSVTDKKALNRLGLLMVVYGTVLGGALPQLGRALELGFLCLSFSSYKVEALWHLLLRAPVRVK